MSGLATKAEIRSKTGVDGRVLRRVYLNGKELPHYLAVDNINVSPREEVLGMYGLTVTFLIDGPVTFTDVDRYTAL